MWSRHIPQPVGSSAYTLLDYEAGHDDFSDDPDPYRKYFGTTMPAYLVESTEWWKRQSRDLLAMSDECEMGLMTTMVTITHNDNCPEMLAVIRRGPFAEPTEDEMLESYMGIKPSHRKRPEAEHHALEHVLSYQRRVHAVKQEFMPRNRRGPLGWLLDWWDRTEAQMRNSLHAHILLWFRRRDKARQPGHQPVEPVKRAADNPGHESRQRPPWASSPALEPFQEDEMYYDAEVARVNAEMVRPTAATRSDGATWGGFDLDLFDIAGLARAVQARLYVHKCTPRYCLQNRTSCRFFFPWPRQPQQQYDENTHRVALARWLPEDDAWIVPHDLELAMFSPSTINVLPFDPKRGSEQAHQYATKYAAKGEKYYYLETVRDGVKDFLKSRTVGLCMCINRLLGFHVVRATRSVQFLLTQFVFKSDVEKRSSAHIARHPGYPDPVFYMKYPQEKYFFRSPALRHLRLAQFARYFAPATGQSADAVMEDTVAADVDDPHVDKSHKDYDHRAQSMQVGKKFGGMNEYATTMRRRANTELACTRTRFIEPFGDQREDFYEQRLLLGLPWYCTHDPELIDDAAGKWSKWRVTAALAELQPLGEVRLPLVEMEVGAGCNISFEEECLKLEELFCMPEHDLVCECCAGDLDEPPCPSCKFAVGFHMCEHRQDRLRWRKGTLYAGEYDAALALYKLHRMMLPLDTLREKAHAYTEAGRLSQSMAENVIRTIQEERGESAEPNAMLTFEDGTNETARSDGPAVQVGASLDALRTLLQEREKKMRAGRASDDGAGGGGDTDQWRVYTKITAAIRDGRYLRLMVQASAGTGKTFLLTTVALWCKVHGQTRHSEAMVAKAAAPTGIAAANIDLSGTDIAASTVHHLFGMDSELQSKLDFGKPDDERVRELLRMRVFLLDEAPMLDVDCWWQLQAIFSQMNARRQGQRATTNDDFGDVHVILFGDLKQLPPATGRPPFIVLESVFTSFDFEELAQNRRVVDDANRSDELDKFHAVLDDTSRGVATPRVRDFIVQAYAAGAGITAKTVELEGSTGAFTKRRYKDLNNAIMMRRIARAHNHSLKVKGQCRPKGTRGQWYLESRVKSIRKRSRTQALWVLHLAGDWNGEGTKRAPLANPHLMRVMLVSNLDVKHRFANGTQGRLLHWCPSEVEKGKSLNAGFRGLHARFVKESAYKACAELQKVTDWMDVEVRENTLTGRDCRSVLVQMPLTPAYNLTIHKMQALSVKHDVLGCMEGVFAYGQVYVLFSRVTDPTLLKLIGVPPADLLDDVAKAWQARGLDVNKCFRDACSVTGEWEYTDAPPQLATVNVASRMKQRYRAWQTMPMKLRTLEEVLNPQPEAMQVYKRYLDWIRRVVLASHNGGQRPDFVTEGGEAILPEDGATWWLTNAQRHAANTKEVQHRGDEDGPADVSSADELAAEADKAAEVDDDSDGGSAEDEDDTDEPFYSTDAYNTPYAQDVDQKNQMDTRVVWRSAIQERAATDMAMATPNTAPESTPRAGQADADAGTPTAGASQSPFMRACGHLPSSFD